MESYIEETKRSYEQEAFQRGELVHLAVGEYKRARYEKPENHSNDHALSTALSRP